MNDFNQYSSTTRTGEGLAVDEGLRSYMLGVYNYMGLGLAATAAIAMLFISNEGLMAAALTFRWIPFIGILALGFLGPRMIFSSGSTAVAHGIYWAYVALWGVLVGPVVAYYGQALGMYNEVAQAFFIAAAVFGATSLYGYTTKKDLAPMAKFLFMATIGLVLAIVLNALFFKLTMLSLITSCLTVLVFSAITAYETQMIKNLYREGAGEVNKRASIFGAFSLYGSFVVLFMHILNILGIVRE